MNRRQALRGGLVAAIAGTIPLPVLQKAIQLHNVEIDIDENKKATMRIDGGEEIPLRSVTLSVKHHPYMASARFMGSLQGE